MASLGPLVESQYSCTTLSISNADGTNPKGPTAATPSGTIRKLKRVIMVTGPTTAPAAVQIYVYKSDGTTIIPINYFSCGTSANAFVTGYTTDESLPVGYSEYAQARTSLTSGATVILGFERADLTASS